MKIANMKRKVVAVLATGALAGAVLVAAPTQAEAQRFVVGVHVGGPAYYGPRYAYAPPVYGYGYGYGHPGYGYGHYDRWHRGGWRR